MSTQPISENRAFEMVTPGEFAKLDHHGVRHAEMRAAVEAMKSMVVGEGVRVKVFGTMRQIDCKRKAAVQMATKLDLPIETLFRNGYLYIRRIKNWK